MGDIRGHIKKLAQGGDELYAKVCKVISVSANTIDVEPIDGSAAIFDIPVNPDAEIKGLKLNPKVASHVLIVFTDKHTARICAVSALDSFKYEVDSVVLDIDTQGFGLKRGTDSLKSLIGELFQAIYTMTFNTTSPGNPTVPAPVNIAQFQILEQKFNQLLK